MRTFKIFAGVLIASLLLAACAALPGAQPQPSATPLPPTPQDAPIQPPSAVLAAQLALAERLGFDVGDVTITKIEEVEWSDSCLGLGGPAESCLMAVVPGFRVLMSVEGETYEVRTDRAGETIRFAEEPQTGGATGGEVVAGETIRQMLAKRLGLDLDAVSLVSVEAVDWPDSCLGYGSPVELCAAVITPGYRVIVEAGGAPYEFHTDAEVLRVRTKGGDETFTSLPEAVLEEIARQVNVERSALVVSRTEQMDWPDACLGVVPQNDLVCAQAITPGWLVVVEVDGKSREFHSNMNGSNVIEFVEAGAQNGAPVSLVWQIEGETCREVRVNGEAIFYGSCNSDDVKENRLNEDQVKELAYLNETFHSFRALTPAGSVVFIGHGAQMPTLVQQRAFAEWAALARASVEAQTNSALAAQPALTWKREGGFAGFCDALALAASGFVRATSCKQPAQEYQPRMVSSEQLQKLYDWMETYAAYQLDQKDSAAADAMHVQMTFGGRGRQNHTEALDRLLLAFITQVYTEAQQTPQ